MLDRSKVLRELQGISDQLFIDNSVCYERARELWHTIAHDVTFINKAKASQAKSPWLIPSWQEKLDQSIPLASKIDKYRVLAVDGSQIYPDRHQGTACYLINIGTVVLTYGGQGKAVMFDSKPSVYIGQDEAGFDVSAELVNCRRQELEFNHGLELSKQLQPETESSGAPFIFLFDGSLIFWHLESKDMDLKDTFLSKYLAVLHQLYKTKTLTAGYISLPKNKELVNLMRLQECDFIFDGVDDSDVDDYYGYNKFPKNAQNSDLDFLIDTTVAHFFLEPYSRSIVFKNNSPICSQYPDYLHAHFFYLHVGTEIGRVEIPAWIAQNTELVDIVATILIDQSIKGRGYPVAIAESHEQAVVKGPDREFFYQLICKIGFERNRRLVMSQKSIKKRGMGV